MKVGDRRYCNATCRSHAPSDAALDALASVNPFDLREHVNAASQGNCPVCQGEGPIDLYSSYNVYSFVIMTKWSTDTRVSCKTCARKANGVNALANVLLGWWGFPFGLVMTPVQLSRNLAGLVKSAPDEPSVAFQELIADDVARRLPR